MQETKTGQELDTGKRKKKHRPSVAVGLWFIKRIEKILMHYSLVEDRPIFDAGEFDWVDSLEVNWQRIRAELEQVMGGGRELPNFQDISRDQANITRDDRWKTFFLYGYGYRMDSNCRQCPETTRLIEGIPGMFTGFFSILAPGKHIPLHRGPYKGLLRCHLALIVPGPEEECWIEVGGEKAHWREGRCLVFDDTYKHRVENNTEGTRVVLFIDVLRPLRFPGSLLNRVILQLIRWSPFIRDAVKNHRAWEKRVGEA